MATSRDMEEGFFGVVCPFSVRQFVALRKGVVGPFREISCHVVDAQGIGKEHGFGIGARAHAGARAFGVVVDVPCGEGKQTSELSGIGGDGDAGDVVWDVGVWGEVHRPVVCQEISAACGIFPFIFSWEADALAQGVMVAEFLFKFALVLGWAVSVWGCVAGIKEVDAVAHGVEVIGEKVGNACGLVPRQVGCGVTGAVLTGLCGVHPYFVSAVEFVFHDAEIAVRRKLSFGFQDSV